MEGIEGSDIPLVTTVPQTSGGGNRCAAVFLRILVHLDISPAYSIHRT
jgi:hypothetical protein